MRNTSKRIDRFIDWFIGEYVPHSGFQFGASNDGWIEDPDRMQRCEDAAADGADGSTHGEVINDWREAFKHFVRYDRKRNPWSAGYARFEAAVEAHFDAVEQWHADHGSLDQQIG